MGVFVYVLRSLRDGKRYIGITDNIERRLSEHNAGKVRSTKARCLFRLVHVVNLASKIDAREKEKYFKTASGRRYLDKIESGE